MLLIFLARLQVLSVVSRVRLLVEVSILLVLHLTVQQRVLHQVLVHRDLLVRLHLEAQVLLHLEPLVALHQSLLLEAQVALQVLPHLELLLLLPAHLHLARHRQVLVPHHLQVLAVRHLVHHHPALVACPVALQVLRPVLPQANLLRVRRRLAQAAHLVEIPASRLATCLPPALVSLHLEVFTLVVRHLTVLL